MVLFVIGVIVGAVGSTFYLQRDELRRELKARLRRFVEEDDGARDRGASRITPLS